MDIDKPKRKITVEPIEEPAPSRREPDPEPTREPLPEPIKEPEKV
jgi:hypothetical protein